MSHDFEPQRLIGQWQQSLTGEHPPVYDAFDQLYQEGHEALKVVAGMTPGEINALPATSKRELAEETADVIIAGYGLIETLGEDFEQLFWQKLGCMIEKYPPTLIREIMSGQHLDRRDAMGQAKTIWEKKTLSGGSRTTAITTG